MSRQHKLREQVWAIVRIDGSTLTPEAVVVTAVHRDRARALAERERLSAVNADKAAIYVCCETRLFGGEDEGSGD